MYHHAQLVRTFHASVVKKEVIASMTSFLYSSVISRITWKEREESLEAHIPPFWSLARRGRTGVRTKARDSSFLLFCLVLLYVKYHFLIIEVIHVLGKPRNK